MNLKKIATVALGSAATLAVMAGPALASATFYPTTVFELDAAGEATDVVAHGAGTGFVGKGDVQQTFGWNNAAAQSNATLVDFLLNVTTEHEVICQQEGSVTFTNPAGKVVTHKVVTTDKVDAETAVAYDTATTAKKNSQYVGFKLSGMTVISSQEKPVKGQACTMDDETAGEVIAVTGPNGGGVVATSSLHPVWKKTGVAPIVGAPVWVDGVSTF